MGGMKVAVDFDLCESNAVCMGIVPEVFEVREDDFLYVLDEHPPEALRPSVEQAVAACPRAAISLVEDDEG
jgi:ferredoxin